MNIVYWFTFEDRVKNKTPPYYYIGSKLNCSFENGIIYDSSGKEYWSSCKQKRFLNAVMLQKPSVKIIQIDDDLDVIEAERKYQLEVNARDNPDYFNLVYAGGGFGVSGETHPAKDPEVREHMRLANYMNRDDFRPWKTSRANIESWKLSHIAYENYVLLLSSNLYAKTPGWRRVKGNINITDATAKSMVKYFNSGWIPLEDPEYCELCQL